MSYDIQLKDPVTNETLHSDVIHDMRGGTYAIGGTTELWLNITYNYASYYYEATENDERFAHDEPVSANDPTVQTEYGIRGIYGKTGAESIPMLKDLINRIEQKYKTPEGWLTGQRERRKYFDKNNNEIDCITAIETNQTNTEVIETYTVSEGDTSNYWEKTAANAIKPLYQLIAMAQLRPDGVWDGD